MLNHHHKTLLLLLLLLDATHFSKESHRSYIPVNSVSTHFVAIPFFPLPLYQRKKKERYTGGKKRGASDSIAA